MDTNRKQTSWLSSGPSLGSRYPPSLNEEPRQCLPQPLQKGPQCAHFHGHYDLHTGFVQEEDGKGQEWARAGGVQ